MVCKNRKYPNTPVYDCQSRQLIIPETSHSAHHRDGQIDSAQQSALSPWLAHTSTHGYITDDKADRRSCELHADDMVDLLSQVCSVVNWKLSLMKRTLWILIQAHQSMYLSVNNVLSKLISARTPVLRWKVCKGGPTIDSRMYRGAQTSYSIWVTKWWSLKWMNTSTWKSPSVRGLEDVQRGSGGGRCTGYVLRINPDAYKSVGKNASHEERMRAREGDGQHQRQLDAWWCDPGTVVDVLVYAHVLRWRRQDSETCLKIRSCATNYT
jgi:hypothetical protein